MKKYADSVIVLFDSDEAGTRAALRAIEVLKENGIKGKVLQVKDAKDPDEYIKKFGAEAFFNLLNTAKSYILFKIEKEAEKYDLSKIEDKISFTNVVADILSKISNSIEQEAYLKEIARLTDISEESIKNEIVKLTDKFEVNLNNKKYNKPKYATNSQGIDEARKFILKVLIKNNYIYSKVKEVLKPEEFIEQLYVKLAFLIDKFYEEKKTLYPAELINYFESIDEQNAVSRIFMENMDIENENFEKLLNDQLKQIKLAYINHEISSVKDVLEIQNYIKEKRKIDSLNITLSDG